MEYAAEKAARLQETLTQAAQNNPNMDSPTVTVNKVKDIGENHQKQSSRKQWYHTKQDWVFSSLVRPMVLQVGNG